jgi:predicted DNA binding CopG/RHH family protein
MSGKKALKSFPEFKSDAEAEDFVENANLTSYDLSEFTPVRFEFDKKTAQVNLRMPERLVKAIKDRAKARGMPYQRFIREALEKALG